MCHTVFKCKAKQIILKTRYKPPIFHLLHIPTNFCLLRIINEVISLSHEPSLLNYTLT